MVVIAVENLDVDASVGHPAADLAELAGFVLPETLDEHLTYGEHAKAGGDEGVPRRGPVGHKEVGRAAAVDDPGAATLDADARAISSCATTCSR